MNKESRKTFEIDITPRKIFRVVGGAVMLFGAVSTLASVERYAEARDVAEHGSPIRINGMDITTSQFNVLRDEGDTDLAIAAAAGVAGGLVFFAAKDLGNKTS